jgi:hypothetical protein
MDSLPNELLLRIADAFVNYKDIRNYMLVCKKTAAISHDNIIWKKFCSKKTHDHECYHNVKYCGIIMIRNMGHSIGGHWHVDNSYAKSKLVSELKYKIITNVLTVGQLKKNNDGVVTLFRYFNNHDLSKLEFHLKYGTYVDELIDNKSPNIMI